MYCFSFNLTPAVCIWWLELDFKVDSWVVFVFAVLDELKKCF